MNNKLKEYTNSIFKNASFWARKYWSRIIVQQEESAIDSLHASPFQTTLQDFFKQVLNLDTGKYRFFRIVGDSMAPTLYQKDMLITQAVENIEDVKDGDIYVFETSTNTIVKRGYLYHFKTPFFILKSDNSDFRTFALPLHKIKNIWQAKFRITNNLTFFSVIE